MKPKEIAKIQDEVERLEEQIERLSKKWTEDRFQAELLYVRLANMSGVRKYANSIREVELTTNPRFPDLLARLLKVIA